MTATALLRASCALLLLLTFAACDTGEGPSLFDPIEDGSYVSRVDPVLTKISPDPGQALAGVTTLTLIGNNFSTSRDSTFVYFAGERQPILSLSPTEITLKAPNMPRPGIPVKVSVLRAENFSQTINYELLPAVVRLDTEVPVNEVTRAVTVGPNGDVFFGRRSISAGVSTPTGTIKVSDDNTTEVYNSSAQSYSDLEFFNGELLGVRGVAAVFAIPEGGTNTITRFIMSRFGAGGLNATALDASGGALWVGGFGNAVLLRIASDGSGTTTPVQGEVVAIEARADFLYAAMLIATSNPERPQSTIIRFPLTNGEISGASEVFFDITASYPNLQATSIAADATGALFVGMQTVSKLPDPIQSNEIPLIRISSSGDSAAPFYPGLLRGITYGLEWVADGSPFLVVSGPRLVADPESLSKESGLLRVNTSVEGER